jgi:PhnB protein
MVQPIPTGYHNITPYLIVRNAAAAIDFYKKALNAVELMRFPGPGGKIMHAEVKIGDSPVMLAEEMPEEGYVGPQTLGGVGVSMMLYVEDVDTRFAQAVAAGATIKRPVQDQFYGDRTGTLVDPFGHVWSIGTHKEDVSMEELQQRMAKLGQS